MIERELQVRLKQAFPPLEPDAEQDLWPLMQRRLAAVPTVRFSWVDWAVAGALLVLSILFRDAIPIVLYLF